MKEEMHVFKMIGARLFLDEKELHCVTGLKIVAGSENGVDPTRAIVTINLEVLLGD